MNLAINGFGRIGRLALRIALLHHADRFNQIVVNTSGSMPVSGWAHLLRYDTAYHKFAKEVKIEEAKDPQTVTDADPLIGYLIADDKKIPVLAQRDPAKLPWGKYGIDVVIESTGKFTDQEGAGKHLQAGAKKVVISAPAKGGHIPTYVLSVNQAGEEAVISNASCTTNCLTPIVEVINHQFGIKKAFMTTVHAYTDDQNIQDGSHHDLRRARAAAANIIPTTTGAALSTTEVIPELKGKFDGYALRVPVITGSLANIVCVTARPVTKDEINQALETAGRQPKFQAILKVSHEPLVSSDIVGDSYSAIVDAEFTNVVDGDLVSILAWYDNEWGYTCRLVEQALVMGQ